ncbi:DUF6522 family protein [Pikeienuella sp. HZG-20]|uniref:DUF6522 family protein n=1 Tax=Paludibacillus litoralis TaxID=3133267 RepID=UPI0030EBB3E0
MTRIDRAGDDVQIDADILARAFAISVDDLKRGMREGAITSRLERGEEEDAGKLRLTFFSAGRHVQIIADEAGAILSSSTMNVATPTFLTENAAHEQD